MRCKPYRNAFGCIPNSINKKIAQRSSMACLRSNSTELENSDWSTPDWSTTKWNFFSSLLPLFYTLVLSSHTGKHCPLVNQAFTNSPFSRVKDLGNGFIFPIPLTLHFNLPHRLQTSLMFICLPWFIKKNKHIGSRSSISKEYLATIQYTKTLVS